MARRPKTKTKTRPRPESPVPLPKRPFRDSAIFHAVLAGLLLLVTWLTGGELPRALVVAGGYFVIATAWSWWRFKQRLDRAAAADAGTPDVRGPRTPPGPGS